MSRSRSRFLFIASLALYGTTVGCDPVSLDGHSVQTCLESATGTSSLTLGQLVDGAFEPLASGSPLAVHAGSQGGFHSDVVLLLRGDGADEWAESGLAYDVDVSGGWEESQLGDLVPECRRLGTVGYFHESRMFWSGPGCGEDPCTGEDDQSAACWEYRECDEMEMEGFATISWSELTSQTVTVNAQAASAAFDATAEVGGITLVTGTAERGEG
jgi:hypothetical protein